MKCRHCNAEVTISLVDLGSAPLSNAYLTSQSLYGPEKWYPLKVVVCESCRLVQTEENSDPSELFNEEYAYFSSFSTMWLKHAEEYVNVMFNRFELNKDSHVVEVASNDGYLLQFVNQKGAQSLGIEPTAGTAAAARQKGVETIEEFFGVSTAQNLVEQGKQADLMAANNVLAHVPDINDFINGFCILLKPKGVATFEFPHLMQMIGQNQFDTIYHEHFSYLSLTAVMQIFSANGLSVFDVDELGTHGGSLRVFAQRSDTGIHLITIKVAELLDRETAAGINQTEYYQGFQQNADKVKNDFLSFLLEAKRQGKKVAAYGAAAKGNTLMNYAGVRPDLISFVVDRNPAKQSKFMPGSRIPIVTEDFLHTEKPDFVIILPWNLKTEIMLQLNYIRTWGGQFVAAVPHLEIFP
ncbi:MAG: class I SAM-dependent methyltransferase [Sediminibacterium sp.]|nr:class I SAM-dependent methyltransferase [Sediminibacterium sp.]